MTGIRPFQLILIGIFAAFALAGLIMFAAFRGLSGEQGPIAAGVEVWGTFDAQTMRSLIGEYSKSNEDWNKVTYVRKDPRTFETEFTNALAEGRGPDLVIIPSDWLVKDRSKLIPLNALSLRDFRDAYVEGGEIFLFTEGMYAFPLAVDPLVMYWNRDLFSAKGVAAPPRTWEEFVSTTVPRLTTRVGGQVIEAAVGLGEYSNVSNAKSIFLMLAMQAGSSLVTVDQNGRFAVTLNDSIGTSALQPGTAALRFYTDFVNPSTNVYTWSRSFALDRSRFLSGDVAMYFGLASERKALEAGNPNLNFDVTEVPQSAGASILRNYGTVYGIGVARGSDNQLGAFEVARSLASPYASSVITKAVDLAPVHRSLIAAGSSDPFNAVMLRAALIARGWLDPDPTVSSGIFSEMIQSVTSGTLRVNQAAQDASQRLQYAF